MKRNEQDMGAVVRIANDYRASANFETLTNWFGEDGWIFRGLEKTEYSLSCSIERKSNWKEREEHFRGYREDFFPTTEKLSLLIWLSQQQMPTRIVSFTEVFYKALRYALDKEYRAHGSDSGEDLVVWALRKKYLLYLGDDGGYDEKKYEKVAQDFANSIGYDYSNQLGIVPVRRNGIFNETEWFLFPCREVGFEDNLEAVLNYDVRTLQRVEASEILSVEQLIGKYPQSATGFVVLKIIVPLLAKEKAIEYCREMALKENQTI